MKGGDLVPSGRDGNAVLILVTFRNVLRAWLSPVVGGGQRTNSCW